MFRKKYLILSRLPQACNPCERIFIDPPDLNRETLDFGTAWRRLNRQR